MSHINWQGKRPSITVAELIKVLQQYPTNLQVVFEWEGQEVSITQADVEYRKTSGFVAIDVEGRN